jgi:hypothetical protein
MPLTSFNKSFTEKPTSADISNKQEDSMLVVSAQDAPEYIARNLEQASNELEQIYYSHKGRTILKWHHFLAIYERHLKAYKTFALGNNSISASIAPAGNLRVLEIGVQNGGSLQMWRRYFGPAAKIFGIDIDPRCKGFEEDGCQIRIGDQRY